MPGTAKFLELVSRNVLTRYGFALASMLAAFLVAWALRLLGSYSADVVFFAAVAFSAWLCGIGPSVATVILGLLSTSYLLPLVQPALGKSSATQPLGIVVFLLICGVMVVIGELSRRETQALRRAQGDLEERVRQRTVDLDAANQSLRELTARLMRSQDDERRRIARELHDSVGQSLAALSMNLSAVGSQIEGLLKTAGTVADSVALVDDMSTDIRTISYLLHPPLLDEAGLSSALRWYVEGFSERSGINVKLEFPDHFARLGRDLETAIFRVVQECLTNIHRHSDSLTARICFAQSPTQVRLEVEDEGHGIPEEKLQEILSSGLPGVGLRGMRERVRQLGGNLDIGPGSNKKGTVVVAAFPVAATAQNTPFEASASAAD